MTQQVPGPKGAKIEQHHMVPVPANMGFSQEEFVIQLCDVKV